MEPIYYYPSTYIGFSKTRKSNRCSRETYEWFLNFYARSARNFALETLPFGGLYIAGGIAMHNQDAFTKSFSREFVNNLCMKDILKKIPVLLIKNYDISLLGAAYALVVKKI